MRRTKLRPSSASSGVKTEVGSSKDHETLVDVEELQKLELLFLAGGELARPTVERYPKRHTGEKGLEPFALAPPVDHERGVGACDHEALGAGERRHEGEVLIDHADAEGPAVARGGDRDFAVVENTEPSSAR